MQLIIFLYLCQNLNKMSNRKMNGFFAYVLLAVVLSGCGETETEKYDRFMSELECPVVLIGKTDKAVTYPSIVVIDAKGRVRTLSASGNGDGWKMPSAIADSRSVGDTLKPCH